MTEQLNWTELTFFVCSRGRDWGNSSSSYKDISLIIRTPLYLNIRIPPYLNLLLLLSRFSRVRLYATPQTAAHQPTSPSRPWDSPGNNTGVGCHFLLQCMKVKSESEVSQSCQTLATPLTAAYLAPLFVGFSRQKYWSGVPLPSPI